MLGPRQEFQAALFYEFNLEDHVPDDHLLRSVDRFVDLSSIRPHLAPFYSDIGRPSVDPELMIRMLLIGYIMGTFTLEDTTNGVTLIRTAIAPDSSETYFAELLQERFNQIGRERSERYYPIKKALVPLT